jgi:iron complex transport system substrate-binding protein
VRACVVACSLAAAARDGIAADHQAVPAAAVSPPSRIISLVPAITETVFALGLGASVVGVSTYCDEPEQARVLPKVGTFTDPVAEAIIVLRPEIVLTSPSPGNETAVRAIERTGVRVAVVQSEGGLEEARRAMLEVARHLAVAERGERLVASIDARLETIRERAKPLARPRAAVVIGREPLVLAGPASYLGELVDLAGGTNVAQSIGGRWPRVGMEYLVASSPDVIIDLSVAMEDPAEEPAATGSTEREAARARSAAERWAAISDVPAVRNGRVISAHATLMLRPGPRLADAAETMFTALHPDASTSRPPVAATRGIGD